MCKSSHKCKKCNESHRTLLHHDSKPPYKHASTPPLSDNTSSNPTPPPAAHSQSATVNATSSISQSDNFKDDSDKPTLPPTLQMTSQIYVRSHDERRLRSGASIYMISQWLVQQLHCNKHSQFVTISGVQDLSIGVSRHSTSFFIDAVQSAEGNLGDSWWPRLCVSFAWSLASLDVLQFGFAWAGISWSQHEHLFIQEFYEQFDVWHILVILGVLMPLFQQVSVELSLSQWSKEGFDIIWPVMCLR